MEVAPAGLVAFVVLWLICKVLCSDPTRKPEIRRRNGKFG